MPIDARIALMGQPLQLRDFDPVKSMQAAAQLKAAQYDARLSDLKYREVERDISEQRSLRDAFRSSMTADPQTGEPTLNKNQFLNKYGQIAPEKAWTMRQQMEKSQVEKQKADAETQQKQLELIGQVTSAIKGAKARGEDPQIAFDRGIQDLERMGIPVAHLKGQKVDMNVVEHYYQESLSAVQQLAQQKQAQEAKQFEQTQATTRRGQDLSAQSAQAGHQVTTRGQDLSAQTAQAGHGVTMRGQDMTAQTAQEAPQRSADAYNLTVPGRVEVARQTQAEGLAAQGQKAYDAAVAKPLEGEARLRVNTMTQAEEVIQALATEFSPEERASYVGAMGLKLKGKKFEQMLKEFSGNPTDPKLGRFQALLSAAQAEAFSTGGKSLTDTERGVVFGYIPTGEEWSVADFEQKLSLAGQRLPALIDRELAIATTPARDLAAQRKAGNLPNLRGQPAPAPLTQGKAISRAQVQQIMQLKGKTEAEVIDALKAQGFTVR